MSDRATELSTALAAARAAAAAVAHVGDPQAFQKGAAGPATVADLASQVAATVVIQNLSGAAVRIVAEEGWDEVERHGSAALVDAVIAAVNAAGIACTGATCEAALRAGGDRGGSGGFWAIDPLDGTKGYLRGGQFAIAIALVRHGQPDVGVLTAPRFAARGTEQGSGVMLGAVRGGGAWQSGLEGGAQVPVHCKAWSAGQPVRLACSVESAHSAVDEIESIVGGIGVLNSVRMDSQAKYGLVARGCADAYVRRSPTADYVEHIWDHAAGALIAEEAGCQVSDLRGAPLDFALGRGLSANHGVLCAASALHGELLRAFQPLLR